MELKKSMSQKLRMNDRDYSRPGWYFVTIGADYHRYFFGKVKNAEMQPNALGRLVENFWDEIPRHYGHIELGARQVMPNHFHGLIRIVRSGGKALGEIMNMFKGAVTREWRRQASPAAAGSRYTTPAGSRYSEKEPEQIRVWAPNYYDVICFDAEELEVRKKYILANPRRWALRDVPEGMFRQFRYKGNMTVLTDSVNRRPLRVSRRATASHVAGLQTELATFKGTACSTFFSPGERTCLKTLQAGTAGIVWVLPIAMPKSIPMDWTTPFLEGRALWLSAFPDAQETATRSRCEEANRYLSQLCNSLKNRALN